MKLVVGLGNPGKEYVNTRHNVGFELADMFAKRYGCEFKKNTKFNAEYFEVTINGEKVIVIKPLSYMNLSGTVVKKYVDYYKIDVKDILVLHDDLDMVIGKIRVIDNCISGGHNGIRSISGALNSREFVRFKIGIFGQKRDVRVIDHVLGKFTSEEREILDESYSKVGNLLDDFVNCTLDRLKQIYNSMNKKD